MKSLKQFTKGITAAHKMIDSGASGIDALLMLEDMGIDLTDLMEYKAAPTEFKTAGDAGEYEGHFAVFGNIDEGKDISHPGMFKKTLQERGHRVKVFYAHDWMKPVGPTPDTLREDSKGLFAAGHLTLESFWGKETWVLMKDNALNEGSYGFRTVTSEIDGEGIRHLYEVSLFEISPVPIGMNAMTSVQAVKAQLMRALHKESASEFGEVLTDLERFMAILKNDEALVTAEPRRVKLLIDKLEALITDAREWTEHEPNRVSKVKWLEMRAREAEMALQFATS